MVSPKTEKWKILVVSNSEKDYDLIRDMLTDGEDDRFELSWSRMESWAVEDICSGDYQVTLVSNEPDSLNSVEFIEEAAKLCPEETFILINTLKEAGAGASARERGAKGYLTRERLTPDILKVNLKSALEKR